MMKHSYLTGHDVVLYDKQIDTTTVTDNITQYARIRYARNVSIYLELGKIYQLLQHNTDISPSEIP